MNEVQEQFLKTLENLKALAKTKKNTLEYDEILNAFNGIELTEDKDGHDSGVSGEEPHRYSAG